jgi:hypothetical protein
VVVVSGETIWEPFGETVPIDEMVPPAALVEDQERVDDCPRVMDEGFALREQEGRTYVGGGSV